MAHSASVAVGDGLHHPSNDARDLELCQLNTPVGTVVEFFAVRKDLDLLKKVPELASHAEFGHHVEDPATVDLFSKNFV